MANQSPTYRAYIVLEPRREGGKARWVEVGSVWNHSKGEGFDLVIPPGLSVSGRIVCMPKKDAATDELVEESED